MCHCLCEIRDQLEGNLIENLETTDNDLGPSGEHKGKPSVMFTIASKSECGLIGHHGMIYHLFSELPSQIWVFGCIEHCVYNLPVLPLLCPPGHRTIEALLQRMFEADLSPEDDADDEDHDNSLSPELSFPNPAFNTT